MFKFYFNGTEIADLPDGFESISSTVKRDEFTGALVYDADLRFVSYGGQDLYDAIKTAWNANKFGSSLMDIYQRSGTGGYVLIHSGTVFHTDCKWKLVNNSVEFKVDDIGYWTKVNSNKNIESNIDVSLSKNQVAITPAPSFDLEVHKVTSGTYYNQKRKAYKLYDALRYMIDFVSDGTLTFESECFGVGGIYEGYCLVSGEEMLYHNGYLAPRISFQKLMEEVRKRFNVRLAITGTQSAPVVKIEPNSYWYSSSDAFTLTDIPDEVGMGINEGKLFGIVKVGSQKYETTATLHYPDIQSLVTFREESLYFQGVSNIDNSIDLVGSFVVSNGAIEVVLEQMSGYEAYNNEQFLIYYDPSNNKSIQYGTHLYNWPLNNANTLQRHADSFPSNTITNNTNASGDRFLAVHTSAADPVQVAVTVNTIPIVNGPIQFDDDYTAGNDFNQNYGGTVPQGTTVTRLNSYYTAPANSTYGFSASIGLEILGYITPSTNTPVIISAGKLFAQLQFKVFSAGVEIASQDSGFVVIDNIGVYTISGSYFPQLNAGETVEVYLKFDNGLTADPADLQAVFTILPDISTFESTGGIDPTGIVVRNDSNGYKCIKVDFKYPLTLAEYQSIRDSKSGIIKVPLHNNKSVRGWIETVKYDHYSGETTFSLITDGNTIYR